MLTANFEILELQGGERVLDIGCGFGRHAFAAAREGAKVVAADLALDELQEVRATTAAMSGADEIPHGAEITASCSDVTRLPFADGTFDCIIASEVLEHIDNDDLALAELARVLKHKGRMAVTVPSFLPEKVCWKLSDEYHAPKSPGGHVRIYKRKELRLKLARAGFSPRKTHLAHGLHSPYWWLKCAVGPNKENNKLVNAYHRFLCWDIEKSPIVTKALEALLRPFLGKSLVMYAVRDQYIKI